MKENENQAVEIYDQRQFMDRFNFRRQFYEPYFSIMEFAKNEIRAKCGNDHVPDSMQDHLIGEWNLMDGLIKLEANSDYPEC